MYYGFDIGGSKIALGVFNQERRLQWEKRVATPKSSYEDFLQAVEALVREADERFDQQGSVGIGIPGMPETADGTLYAANVPAASGRPLRADLSARLGRDVRLDNDANCFALSEAWDDEFTQYPLVMGLILGTGVGGGLVLNGKSITGHSYITGEFGHIRLPVDALEVVGRDFPLLRCGCGQLGCIENYLSGRGFAWLYEHFLSATAHLAGDCGAVAAARSARPGARGALSRSAGGVSGEYTDHCRPGFAGARRRII